MYVFISGEVGATHMAAAAIGAHLVRDCFQGLSPPRH
jgi:hypothetical protein